MRHGGEFLLIFFNQVLPALNRIMNRKMLEVNEKRLVFISLDEIDGGICQLIGVVIALVRRQ